MKFCKACGNELKNYVSFCSNCGTKVKDSEPAGTTDAVENEESSHSAVTGNELKENFSSTLSNAKKTVQQSQYFNYFTATLKRPSSAIEFKSSAFGWINILLLAATTTWASYNILIGFIKGVLTEVGGFPFFAQENSIFGALRNEIIPRFFLVNLVIILTFMVCAFLILKYTSKSDKRFNQLLSELGGLLTPNIAFSLVIALFTTLFSSPTNILLAMGALFFSFMYYYVVYNYYLYSRASIKGLDIVYVLSISNLIVIVVFFIIGYLQLEPMFAFFEQIDEMLYQFNW